MRSISRVLLITLMAALLPVRGWLGDAMAVQMGAQTITAAATIATTSVAPKDQTTRAPSGFDSENAIPSHPDCPGHAAMASSNSQPDASSSMNDSCQGCSACQVCHTVALAVAAHALDAARASHAEPSHTPRMLASADAAQSFKPPVS